MGNQYKRARKLRIGGYVSTRSIYCEEDVRLMADAGMNAVFVPWENREQRDNLLRWCAKYGIEVILFERYFHRLGPDPAEPAADYRERMAEFTDGLADVPNYLGSALFDEPHATMFPQCEKLTRAFKEHLPEHIALTNLLPNYGTPNQLAGYPEWILTDEQREAWNREHMASMTYREHLEQFVAAVPTEVLSADIYPFYWVDGKKITLPGYMQGLSDLSEVAREHGQELCIVLQCLNNVPGYVRSVETAALRFQLYCAMAFGATWFFYWTYEAGYGVPEADGYLDHDGRPTPLYYRAQPVNREAVALSDVLCRYRSLGAFAINEPMVPRDTMKGAKYTAAKLSYLEFTPQYDGLPAVKAVESASPLLVGCFAERDGGGSAMIVVNAEDLEMEKPASVRFSLTEDMAVTAYPYGLPAVLLPDEKGVYHLELESGNGVLITLSPAGC